MAPLGLRHGGKFFRAQCLTMGAVATHLGTRQDDLKSEMAFDLFPHGLEEIAKNSSIFPQRRQITCACSCFRRVS